MYGVPSTLSLEPFVGHDLDQICLGRAQIQLRWSGIGSIDIEGRWELRDSTGSVVNACEEHLERASYRIHRIIGVPVARFSLDPPRAFTLFFDNGLKLAVFDDSPQYESFSIHVEGRPSVYV